jgi:hypothetical protein
MPHWLRRGGRVYGRFGALGRLKRWALEWYYTKVAIVCMVSASKKIRARRATKIRLTRALCKENCKRTVSLGIPICIFGKNTPDPCSWTSQYRIRKYSLECIQFANYSNLLNKGMVSRPVTRTEISSWSYPIGNQMNPRTSHFLQCCDRFSVVVEWFCSLKFSMTNWKSR